MHTSVKLMRFQWIAEAVNKRGDFDLHYELYRPWRKYEAVIFLKSMGEESLAIARKLKSKGVKIIFDANVDYFTPAKGEFFYHGMAPTEAQRICALKMVGLSDAVIGDSRHLAEIASGYNRVVEWIPDNVPDDLIKMNRTPRKFEANSRMKVFWSGEAVKLFELLLIRDVLVSLSEHIHLVLITNSLESLDRWFKSYKNQFYDLMGLLSHEFLEFRSIEDLMAIYDQGGIIISPRHLNNTYNMGHTEWKISLGMARGCIALCSPQPSYVDISDRASGQGIRICANSRDWTQAFETLKDDDFDWEGERSAACSVVRTHYATSVVADSHAKFVISVMKQ